jgi:ribonucleotide reductase beta subunit family protein with ferritin-like domain
MSLIKQNGLAPFKTDKGFVYPQFWEYYKNHDRIHWTADEISLSKDTADFAKASTEEQDSH